MDVFDQLLEEKPFGKITVKELVERCGVNRNTFYYHFRDIPDLLESMVKEKADEIIRHHDQLWSIMDCLQLMIQYCAAHRRAILHIYHSIQRDVFVDNLERLAVYAVEEFVTAATADLPVPPEDRRLLIRYYKCLLIGVSLDWLNSNIDYDLSASMGRIFGLFSGSTRKAILKLIEEERGEAGAENCS